MNFPGENFMRRLTIVAALMVAAMLVCLPASAQDIMTTAIGGGPNGIPALNGNVYNPLGVAVDAAGNYYFTSYYQNRVFKVNTAGTISVVAGSGAQGFTGDGVAGGAVNASLYHPYGVAVDTASPPNVYIADYNNCVVRKVTASTGTITTIAGIGGQCGYAGDGGKGTAANLYFTTGVALDSLGNLYVSDFNNCVVRRVVLATDVISTYAGNHTCGYTGDGGGAASAELENPIGLAVDSSNDLFIADYNNYVIRKVTKATNKISTVAGNHTAGFTGDGGLATSAELNYPAGLAVNSAGTVVTFSDVTNQRIRQFTVGGNINTIAGTGTACGSGTCGEGGAAISAQLYNPYGVAETSGGKIYFANQSYNSIDSFTVGGILNLVAGNHSGTVETLTNGVPWNGVELNSPYQIATDNAGDVFIADSGDFMVRKAVKASGLVNFFAGNGTSGYLGDGGPAISAELANTFGVATNGAGTLVYAGDTYSCAVRNVTGGNINLFAGLVISNSWRCGYTGDGGSATAAQLNSPYGVALDSKGGVYIADTSNHVIRKVTGGTINTIAGLGGLAGYSGDGGPAVNAQLYNPYAIALDPAGNVFIADYQNCRIREIGAVTGIITTVAGTGNCAFTNDGLATSSGLAYPQGIAVDANDNLFISDTNNQRIRWVSPNGIMTTIAGTGAAGYNGDGILATTATMSSPTGVALDPDGNILVSDYYNSRVRSISAFPALGTSVGNLAFGLTSVGSTSTPQTFSVSALGPVTISNISTSGNYSEADNCPASLANGTTCTMYVYFVPTGSGTLTGNITINNNGYFNQTNTVALTGVGSAILLTGAPVSFGNQLVKTTSPSKAATVTNKGTTAITMGAITLTNTTDYGIVSNTCPASGATLAGGASCTITTHFTPKSTGPQRGSVVINDSDPSSPQLVGLSGTGTSSVALSPSSIIFPTTAVGIPSTATKITLTNSTGVSITLGATPLTVTGPFAIATATTTCTPTLVIAAGGTCIINVQFKPTKVGFISGSLSVADSDVTSPQSVAMQGYGTGIKFTPTTLNFGTVTRNNQVSSTATITNVGTTPVFFTGGELSGTNSANFIVAGNDAPPCNNTAANPLQPGKTCQITVYFDPTVTGAEKATYKVFDNSVGSPQSLNLTGTGQ
jgi:sugar lactone lactonase YvrE